MYNRPKNTVDSTVIYLLMILVV